MKAEDVYLHLAEKCERAAVAADLPSTKVEMLASAAVWRRLADDCRLREGEQIDNAPRTRSVRHRSEIDAKGAD